MADGFRKSFLGFNCNDVIDYIKKTHAEFSQKEKELNQKIEETLKELQAEKEKNSELCDQLSDAYSALEEYRKKEEEINRISENIGKLYIVSQANARAVIDAADENRRKASFEVQKNIDALKNAHKELTSIIKGVTDTSVGFTDNMKTLSGELDLAIESINKNNEQCDESIKETEKVLSSQE